jgi:ketosteroid isomerase-like protein
MKILVGLFLVCACFAPSHGQEKKPATSATADELKQLEHDWTDAMKAGDVDKLGQILADDWAGLYSDGARKTKKQVLAEVKSGDSKLESFEFGPMDVKSFGTAVAVVQGSDTEKSSLKGKDSSGRWVWMDVFVKRNGKWQAVRSQAAKVVP